MSGHYQLIHEWFEDIPYLMLVPPDHGQNAPLVLVLHGQESRKENSLPRLWAYAAAGFRAIAFDLRHHGERRAPSDATLSQDPNFAAKFYETVTGSTEDISRLLDHLQAPHAAIYGVSLGGIITFAALLAEPRLAVATVAMGSPDWGGLMRQVGLSPGHPFYDQVVLFSPLEIADQIYPPRPLLMLHGEDDTIVPVSGVRALYERLRPAYASCPDRLELIVTPGLGHEMTDAMLHRGVTWCERFRSELL